MTLGTLEGEKARRMRTDMMRTGTRSSSAGGGGSGGRSSGSTRSDIARASKSKTDLALKYLTIKASGFLTMFFVQHPIDDTSRLHSHITIEHNSNLFERGEKKRGRNVKSEGFLTGKAMAKLLLWSVAGPNKKMEKSPSSNPDVCVRVQTTATYPLIGNEYTFD